MTQCSNSTQVEETQTCPYGTATKRINAKLESIPEKDIINRHKNYILLCTCTTSSSWEWIHSCCIPITRLLQTKPFTIKNTLNLSIIPVNESR